MTKEEVRLLKFYLSRTNDKKDRKDALLFDYIRKSGEEYNEDRIFRKLYSSTGKNALYRLKNRLHSDISKSIALQYFETSDSGFILNHLLLSKHFQSRQQFRIAFYYLKKAEKRAVQVEKIELLDLIYDDFIKMSHETLQIPPEDYIAKRKENRKKLNKIQEVDDILASVIFKIKTAQTFSSQNDGATDLLQRAVDGFSRDKEVKKVPVLRFKIYEAISRLLLQRNDFRSLERYLVKTFHEFSKEKLFNGNNHNTKLQMLTYLVNTLYKNEKTEHSLKYAEILKNALDEFDGSLRERYLFFYYNALVNNYMGRNDFKKAIKTLMEAQEQKAIQKNVFHTLFIRLNLSVSLFDDKKYKESLGNLVKLYMLEGFSKLDDAFKLKITIFELIVRYELGDTEFIEYKTRQVKKEYFSLLENPLYIRQKEMVNIISDMALSSGSLKEKVLQEKIKNVLSVADSTDNENDVIRYSQWLKRKLKDKLIS